MTRLDPPPLSPLMLMVAPNGARRAKLDHPNIPLNAAEIAQEAKRCHEAGAAAFHIHIRDKEGRHLLDADGYLDVLRHIRQELSLNGTENDKMLLQITTEAVGIYQPAEQMAVVKAVKPPAISMGLREFIRSPADETAAIDFFNWVYQENILAQYILYDPQDVQKLVDLHQRGLLPQKKPWVLLVLGRSKEGPPAQPEALRRFFSYLPTEWCWSVCGFSIWESRIALAAASLGGDVRIGYENNLHLPDGQLTETNADLVLDFKSKITSLGRYLDNDAANFRPFLSDQ